MDEPRSKPVPGSVCLTPDELRSIVCDAMTADDEVVDHVEHCNVCQSALEQLASQDELVSAISIPVLPPHWNAAANNMVRCIAELTACDDNGTVPDFQTLPGPMPPPTIKGYEMVGLLGRGGMGAVYDAIQTGFGRPVAIKVLPEASQTRPESLRRFTREMIAIGQLHHPGIVQAYDAAEDGGLHYLVMEKVSGTTVWQVVRAVTQLSVPDSCEIIRQAAIALQHAHVNGLVHRDIKPSNMMINVQGVVKILDLGLARLTQTDVDSHLELTKTGQILGTIQYMAPEQALGQSDIGIAADIYALGATLYRLITGRALYDFRSHSSVLSKLDAIVNETPRPIRKLRPGVPAELDAIVSRMLCKAPDQRYSQPADVAESIAPFCRGADLAGLCRRSMGHPSTTLLNQAETENASNEEATLQNSVRRSTTIPISRRNAATWIGHHRVTIAAISIVGIVLFVLMTRLQWSTPTAIRQNLQGLPDAATATGNDTVTENSSIIASERVPVPVQAILEPPFPANAVDAKRHQANWATEHQTDVERIVKLSADESLTMILIPPGRFMMGGSDSRFVSEADTYPHPVEITRPFRLAKFETTRGQFRQFIDETGYVTESEQSGEGSFGIRDGEWVKDMMFRWDSSPGEERTENDPVIHVTRRDALAFCAWLSGKDPRHVYALPTEAHWEYACRAGTINYFYYGPRKDAGTFSWHIGNSAGRSHPVGQFPANPFGIHDLYGNVSEMCSDRYAVGFYRQSPRKDPIGSVTGTTYVYRGGCWNDNVLSCNSVIRRHYAVDDRSLCAGFRVSSMETTGSQ